MWRTVDNARGRFGVVAHHARFLDDVTAATLSVRGAVGAVADSARRRAAVVTAVGLNAVDAVAAHACFAREGTTQKREHNDRIKR